jgi:RNA polymerase sigma-70 factor (ECF subfamily)
MVATAHLIAAEIPRLRRYAQALRRNRDDCDDLMQDALLRALEKTHLWQTGTNLSAWLFTILHNQHVNVVRRSARQGHEINAERVDLSSPATQGWQLELRDVERAIARLSDEYRVTLLLIGRDGMTYEEVAEICRVPIGTVRSRLSRARDALRDMLDGTEEGIGRDVNCAKSSFRPKDKLFPAASIRLKAADSRDVAVRQPSRV